MRETSLGHPLATSEAAQVFQTAFEGPTNRCRRGRPLVAFVMVIAVGPCAVDLCRSARGTIWTCTPKPSAAGGGSPRAVSVGGALTFPAQFQMDRGADAQGINEARDDAHHGSSHLAITNRNDTRDSTEGRSIRMRDEQRGIHSRRNMRERSRTLGRTHHNKPGHSRHSSRTLVRRSNRSPGHRRWTLFHRSPHQQLVRLRDRDPNHPATPELVMVSPRQ